MCENCILLPLFKPATSLIQTQSINGSAGRWEMKKNVHFSLATVITGPRWTRTERTDHLAISDVVMSPVLDYSFSHSSGTLVIN